MSHRWEHEDEYIRLRLDINRANREGNTILLGQLQERIKLLDTMRWQAKVVCFTELAPYLTLVDALEQRASSLSLPFPELADHRNKMNDGHFIFGITDSARSIQIWPMEDRGYYNVEVYEYNTDEDRGHPNCYKGHTTSLDETTMVLSRWYVERCSIDDLHTRFPWMSREPFHLSSPRMTFE